MRTCGVKMVTPNDKNYRDFCHRFSISKITLREKGKQTKINELSGVVEKLARIWVASCLPVMEERILSYRQFFSHHNVWRDRHREIDIVTGVAEPEIFIEVKYTSANSTCVSLTGKRQLLESYVIAKRQWPLLRACTIGVSLLNDNPLNVRKLMEAVSRCPANITDAKSVPHVVVGVRQLWESEYYSTLCDENLLCDAFAEYEREQGRKEERQLLKRKPQKLASFSTGDFSKNAFQIAYDAAKKQ